MEWYQNSRLVLAAVIENLVLLVAAMSCFLLYIRRNRAQKTDEEYELLDMLNRYYSQSADHVKRSYNQINMLKHDMRNLLLVTANLIRQGRMRRRSCWMTSCIRLTGYINWWIRIMSMPTLF